MLVGFIREYLVRSFWAGTVDGKVFRMFRKSILGFTEEVWTSYPRQRAFRRLLTASNKGSKSDLASPMLAGSWL